MKTLLIAAALLTAGALAQGTGTRDHGAMHGMDKQAAAKAVGTGTVKAVRAETRTVNLAHDPIPSIGWPNMVMDFKVADGVDLAGLEAGQQVEFDLERQGKAYVVVAIRPKR